MSTSEFRLGECSHLTRLGVPMDGGYVICKNDLEKADFLLSFGLSSEWSFEEDFVKNKTTCPIHVYDHSVSLSIFCKMFISELIKFFIFQSKLKFVYLKLVVLFAYSSFFRDVNRRHFRLKVTSPVHSQLEVSIAEVFSRISSNNIFLKIDIEGSEYRVLHQITQFRDRIVGLVIEFHDINFMLEKFNEILVLLNRDFDIIHVHGNNFSFFNSNLGFPDTLEITFSKISKHQIRTEPFHVPNGFHDFPNDSRVQDFRFNFPSDTANYS